MTEGVTEQRTKKKVLLMGRSGSGKTSMRSIIFANYMARDTQQLGATIDVEHSHVRFLGTLVLNLWDCGGQEVFMEAYLETQRKHIFSNVAVLIYVLDVVSKDQKNDLAYFTNIMRAVKEYSDDAKVFCMLHKMDLIPEDQRKPTFDAKVEELRGAAKDMDFSPYGTSIWDETLYSAWSSIVYALIPNVRSLKKQLNQFAEICDADEVVLFERATFLVIASETLKEHADAHRFEKISNIIKQFKLACNKAQANFQSMEVKSSNFTAFIDSFTQNTYIMVIMSSDTIYPAATRINIVAARQHFERFVKETTGLNQIL